ncbi:conserved hypothetical protein [Theileria orientalis strain Shintoku]|uniref:Uncharacterized protein n=1 Tax=Theileria orientalis strain Shintoku TaxID=869250 RepID=J4D897_THEOR|nr:conserved hypothetical protein [Theileria orientalis strain Shintoku]BAM40655.1 conserved hypothetical protein [Theileria orientalis strain Shintoku]|eukprot:XP_009690956.1 conserved hypothetical protein [Theileria orientalis strain Shintoku]
MSILDHWNNPNLKYCNLAILTAIGIIQSARYLINRNSSDAVESYLKAPNSDKFPSTEELSDPFFEIKMTKNDVKLKKLDSKQFWAVLENQKTKVNIDELWIYEPNYQCLGANLHEVKQVQTVKNGPRKHQKGDKSISGDTKWIHIKTVPKPSTEQLEGHTGELLVLLLIALAGVATVAYKSVNYIKTVQCISFIKNSCRNSKKVTDVIGQKMVLRNLDGDLRTNYFSGDVILSGDNGKELLVVCS